MTENRIRIGLNPLQWNILNSNASETFGIAGVGTGKSFIIGFGLRQALSIQGTVHGLCAPDQKQLDIATMVQVKECWNKIGFYQNEHYVINRNADHWNVPRITDNPHGLLTTKWGSYCFIKGLHDPDLSRGVAWDTIWVDEAGYIHENSREVLISRNRGSRYTQLIESGELNKLTGKPFKHQIYYVTTPPRDPKALRKLHDDSVKANDPEMKFFFGTSYMNAKHLPPNYIANMQSKYDSINFKREVLGEMLTYTSNRFFAGFDKQKSVKTVKPEYAAPIYLSFDFNVDPMTCLACQSYMGQIKVVKEWVLPDAEIPVGREPITYLCELIKPFVLRFPSCYVTGDASGNNRAAITAKGNNCYIAIKTVLGHANFDFVLSQNAEHGQSRVLCNSILEKHPLFSIDSECKGLINDLELVKVKQGVMGVHIDKTDPQLTHISDCFRYYLQAFYESWVDKPVK